VAKKQGLSKMYLENSIKGWPPDNLKIPNVTKPD
jgi:hypothetical protein